MNEVTLYILLGFLLGMSSCAWIIVITLFNRSKFKNNYLKRRILSLEQQCDAVAEQLFLANKMIDRLEDEEPEESQKGSHGYN